MVYVNAHWFMVSYVHNKYIVLHSIKNTVSWFHMFTRSMLYSTASRLSWFSCHASRINVRLLYFNDLVAFLYLTWSSLPETSQLPALRCTVSFQLWSDMPTTNSVLTKRTAVSVLWNPLILQQNLLLSTQPSLRWSRKAHKRSTACEMLYFWNFANFFMVSIDVYEILVCRP